MMRKIRLTLLAAAVLAAIVSCSNDNIVEKNKTAPVSSDKSECFNITFSSGACNSKTFLQGNKLYWLNTDALGFFAIDGETLPASVNLATAQFKAAFNGYTNAPSLLKADFYAPNTVLPSSGKYTYCIIYPYKEGMVWKPNTVESTGYEVPTAQTQAVINRNADIVSANGYAITRVDGKWRTESNIQLGELYPQVAYIELNLSALKTYYGGNTVSSIILESFKNADETLVVGETNPIIAGKFNIDWSKFKATNGMRAITGITNSTNKITLTTESNFVIPVSTNVAPADSAMAYMVILPMSETMDHYKVTVNMTNAAHESVLYEAIGGYDSEGASKNLQLAAGKKYKLALPEEPNMNPITLEYENVVIYWGNDDISNTSNDNSGIGTSDGIIDVHGANYTFNLNTIKAKYADMYLRLPIGMIWNGGNDASKFEIEQTGNSSSPYIIKIFRGQSIDLKVYLAPSIFTSKSVSITAFYNKNDAENNVNVKRTIPISIENRLGYAAGTLTNIFDNAPTLEAGSSKVNGTDGTWTSVNGTDVTYTKNSFINLNLTPTTKLRTNEAIYIGSKNDIKVKLFMQQNEFAMSTQAPTFSATSSNEGELSFSSSNEYVLFVPGSKRGLEMPHKTTNDAWTIDYYYYDIDENTGTLRKNKGATLENMKNNYFIAGDPCKSIKPLNSYRIATDTEVAFIFQNTIWNHHNIQGIGPLVGISLFSGGRWVWNWPKSPYNWGDLLCIYIGTSTGIQSWTESNGTARHISGPMSAAGVPLCVRN